MEGSRPMPTPLSDELLRRMDAYWRAANYLAVGQIYLLDNPLLREPLRIEHVKPRLLAGVVGDGEAETGPLATACHANKFPAPAADGAVLPILPLNGYKIANPTVLARIPRRELESLLVGYGHAPYFVEGDEPATMHRLMAETLDAALDDVAAIQRRARAGEVAERPRWPMIVL